MNFLGEDFDSGKCNQMCDNCRKGLKVVETDRTKEAQSILKFVQRCSEYQTKITAK